MTPKILILLFFISVLTPLYATHYKVTDQIFFDIDINGERLGRIIVGLFGETTPKTVNNFRTITTKGIKNRTYKGSNFHRVVKRFMIQGGDIVFNNGSGSISIYGAQFDDENFDIKHSGPGFISMAKNGPNSNGCQFFITTIATPWLDGEHTVFGKVVEGQALIHKIEHIKTDIYDRPVKNITIINCGIIPTSSYYVSDQPYDLIQWIRAAIIPLLFSTSILLFFHWMIKQLDTTKLHDY